MSIELVVNITQIKSYADRIMNLEVQKRDIDEEVIGIMKEVDKIGINTKAFKQVIKSLMKQDIGFCPYVGALSKYTDMFYGESSNKITSITFKGE